MTEDARKGGEKIPCANPLYRVLLPASVTGTGVQWRTLTGNQYLIYKAYALDSFSVPCGNCQACRIGIAKEWTGRIMMECSEHPNNWFVTLTYDPEHVPIKQGLCHETGEFLEEMTLNKEHVQKFLKRLRKRWKTHYGEENIRFYCSAEYGDEHDRPHYHICLFNFDIKDLEEYPQKNALGHQYYVSKEIKEVWGMGDVRIGELTSMSAGYTARYVMKKWKGKKGLEEWQEKHIKEREFALMSRKPGIGSEYFERNKEKMLRDGFIMVPALEGAYRATTPKSYVYRCRNPGITSKDTVEEVEELENADGSVTRRIITKVDPKKMRVSEEEDLHNRALGRALREKNERAMMATINQKLNQNSLDFESINAMENEILEEKLLALRQKGLT